MSPLFLFLENVPPRRLRSFHPKLIKSENTSKGRLPDRWGEFSLPIPTSIFHHHYRYIIWKGLINPLQLRSFFFSFLASRIRRLILSPAKYTNVPYYPSPSLSSSWMAESQVNCKQSGSQCVYPVVDHFHRDMAIECATMRVTTRNRVEKVKREGKLDFAEFCLHFLNWKYISFPISILKRVLKEFLEKLYYC